MSTSKKVQAEQPDNVEFKDLSQREKLVLQMFRQLDQQQQKDILRFIGVLFNT